MTNFGSKTEWVFEGMTLGKVEPVEEVTVVKDTPSGKLVLTTGIELVETPPEKPQPAENATLELKEKITERVNPELPEFEKQLIVEALVSHRDVFAVEGEPLGACTLAEHAIENGGHTSLQQQLTLAPLKNGS